MTAAPAMGSLRAWILAVAIGSFAAGAVVGHTCTHAAATPAPSPAEAQYARELTERYRLSTEQQRQLHAVLQFASEREIAILRHAQAHQLPREQMAELTALRAATEQRLRKLLDDEQRARYDRDSRPASASAAAEKR